MQNRAAILHKARRYPPVLLVAARLRITDGYTKFLSASKLASKNFAYPPRLMRSFAEQYYYDKLEQSMTILEIYKQYQIMPVLQQHMLRVAAVASLICDNFNEPIDKGSILTACLLHDIGNIIKFQLSEKLPEAVELEGLEYWLKVQENFIQKYGDNDHEASLTIASELGVGDRVLELIGIIGFSQAEENLASHDYGKKICAYSDMRAEPHGLVPLNNRLKELHERYASHPKAKRVKKPFEVLANAQRSIEKQIFGHCSMQPEDINDDSIRSVIEDLKFYEISTI